MLLARFCKTCHVTAAWPSRGEKNRSVGLVHRNAKKYASIFPFPGLLACCRRIGGIRSAIWGESHDARPLAREEVGSTTVAGGHAHVGEGIEFLTASVYSHGRRSEIGRSVYAVLANTSIGTQRGERQYVFFVEPFEKSSAMRFAGPLPSHIPAAAPRMESARESRHQSNPTFESGRQSETRTSSLIPSSTKFTRRDTLSSPPLHHPP